MFHVFRLRNSVLSLTSDFFSTPLSASKCVSLCSLYLSHSLSLLIEEQMTKRHHTDMVSSLFDYVGYLRTLPPTRRRRMNEASRNPATHQLPWSHPMTNMDVATGIYKAEFDGKSHPPYPKPDWSDDRMWAFRQFLLQIRTNDVFSVVADRLPPSIIRIIVNYDNTVFWRTSIPHRNWPIYQLSDRSHEKDMEGDVKMLMEGDVKGDVKKPEIPDLRLVGAIWRTAASAFRDDLIECMACGSFNRIDEVAHVHHAMPAFPDMPANPSPDWAPPILCWPCVSRGCQNLGILAAMSRFFFSVYQKPAAHFCAFLPSHDAVRVIKYAEVPVKPGTKFYRPLSGEVKDFGLTSPTLTSLSKLSKRTLDGLLLPTFPHQTIPRPRYPLLPLDGSCSSIEVISLPVFGVCDLQWLKWRFCSCCSKTWFDKSGSNFALRCESCLASH